MSAAAGRTVAVVGASGEAGSGITRAALARGWRVVAVARRADRLAALRDGVPASQAEALRLLPGSIADEDGGATLATELGNQVDGAVVSVNVPVTPRPVLDWSAGELATLLAGNIGAHLVAARHLLPLVREGGTYLALGGGMADVVIPGFGAMSVVQAGQRMLYRALAKELARSGRQVRVLELLVASMINGPGTRAVAAPEWITDREVGEHVCELLAGDEAGPILTLPSPRPAR